jgi:hypothetical protein
VSGVQLSTSLPTQLSKRAWRSIHPYMSQGCKSRSSANAAGRKECTCAHGGGAQMVHQLTATALRAAAICKGMSTRPRAKYWRTNPTGHLLRPPHDNEHWLGNLPLTGPTKWHGGLKLGTPRPAWPQVEFNRQRL